MAHKSNIYYITISKSQKYKSHLLGGSGFGSFTRLDQVLAGALASLRFDKTKLSIWLYHIPWLGTLVSHWFLVGDPNSSKCGLHIIATMTLQHTR